MKLVLTTKQLEWLNAWTNAVIISLGPSGMTARQRTLFARLRYKFTPNARAVWLKKEELDLVKILIASRARALKERSLATPEMSFLHHLLKTLEGRGQHDSNGFDDNVANSGTTDTSDAQPEPPCPSKAGDIGPGYDAPCCEEAHSPCCEAGGGGQAK